MSARAAERLAVLNEEMTGCTRCGLHETRVGPDIFFGYGPPTARFLIVAGAPTAVDEMYGGLFAGDEGEVLFELMEKAQIPTADCYFTYAVACRPKVFIPKTDTEDERIEGRSPAKDELAACRFRLYEQLYQADPRIILTLGEVATKAMVRGRLPKFVEAVGKQYTCTLPAATREDHEDGKVVGKARHHDLVYPLLAVPEIISIINNPSTATHGPYNVALKTLMRAKAYVDFVTDNEQETMKGAL